MKRYWFYFYILLYKLCMMTKNIDYLFYCKKLYLPNEVDLAVRAQSINVMVFHIVTLTVKVIRITDFRVWLKY